MTRRLAIARVAAAQAQLRVLDTIMDVDLKRWRAELNPTHLLAGSFAAGFATVLLPRRWRMGLSYAVGAVAWPLTRLFGPTLLQNFLRQTQMPE